LFELCLKNNQRISSMPSRRSQETLWRGSQCMGGDRRSEATSADNGDDVWLHSRSVQQCSLSLSLSILRSQ